ncbi:MAG: ATP-binding protein [Halovenus sp.]
MVSAVDGLFAVVIGLGGFLCGLGYVSYRRWDQLGTGGLAAFAVVLGLGSVVSGLLGLVLGASPSEPAQPPWAQAAVFFWAVAAVPWLLFSLQYTGRYTGIRWRTIGLLYAPFVGFGLTVAHSTVGIGGAGVIDAISSIVFIYCIALAFLGVFVVLQATHSYVHLSLTQGIAVVATPLILVIALNSAGMLQRSSPVLAVGTYALALSVGTVLLGGTLAWTPLLERTPAVETMSEQAMTRETEDLIFVVDGTDTIIRYNATATETLSDPPVPGEPVRESLGFDTATLDTRETVSLETESGKRQYDPQVSPITDGRGTEIGAVLSLRDVTDRELREQRLSVLNRVLRHNLRNRVDVLKSHAEALDDDHSGEHVAGIRDAADSITELGKRARTIDQFVSEPGETRQVDLVDAVETICAELVTAEEDVTVTTDLPGPATVETSRRALEAAVESALENALTHAISTVEITVEANRDGYRIVVADDGAGIPERELESLDAGTETPLQHGTGMGLWQLQWAVRTMGGDLSFETADGTTVTFTVPDRKAE